MSGTFMRSGGASGGLTLVLDQGHLAYEDTMMIIERDLVKSTPKLLHGKRTMQGETTIPQPGAPTDVVLTVDGNAVARTTVGRAVPAAFTASETFDVGTGLGSPGSRAYADRAPFAFTGESRQVHVDGAPSQPVGPNHR